MIVFQFAIILTAVFRMQYAYALLARRDVAAAEKWLAAFEKVAATYPYPNEIDSERTLLAIAQSKGLEATVKQS